MIYRKYFKIVMVGNTKDEQDSDVCVLLMVQVAMYISMLQAWNHCEWTRPEIVLATPGYYRKWPWCWRTDPADWWKCLKQSWWRGWMEMERRKIYLIYPYESYDASEDMSEFKRTDPADWWKCWRLLTRMDGDREKANIQTRPFHLNKTTIINLPVWVLRRVWRHVWR